jgi:selenocysteine lyase/cysteine desulfurase
MHIANDLIEWARRQFDPGGVYLNTASIGLPPRPALSALAEAQERWRVGDPDPWDYDYDVARSRRAFAVLAGTTADRVAIASQSSTCAALLAASLEPGDEVLCAEEDFTSVLFPFLARADLSVRCVPLERLLDEVRQSTRLVAVSAVQSLDGRVLDLDTLADVARANGALTYVDTTHAIGWLPVHSDRFTVTACSAYKWLCAPRGVAFMTVTQEAQQWLSPRYANWYAAPDPWQGGYGLPLRLADDARRYDLSPAWFSFVGAAESLELLVKVGIDAICPHNIALANEFRLAVGMPPSNSAVVYLRRDDVESLRQAGVHCVIGEGAARLAFHLYTTHDDVAAAAGAFTRA